MKTILETHKSLLLLAAAIAAPVMAQIPGEVTFLDGGYTEMCAAAAKSVDQPGAFQITGSRLGVPPLEICNAALASTESTVTNRGINHNNRGVLYFAQGSLEEALKDFDEAIRFDATLAQAHVNRGYTLVALKRWNESIVSLTRGIELNTAEMAKAYYNRGVAQEESGNVREAYYDYLKASELNPLWEEPKQELTRFSVTRR